MKRWLYAIVVVFGAPLRSFLKDHICCPARVAEIRPIETQVHCRVVHEESACLTVTNLLRVTAVTVHCKCGIRSGIYIIKTKLWAWGHTWKMLTRRYFLEVVPTVFISTLKIINVSDCVFSRQTSIVVGINHIDILGRQKIHFQRRLRKEMFVVVNKHAN